MNIRSRVSDFAGFAVFSRLTIDLPSQRGVDTQQQGPRAGAASTRCGSACSCSTPRTGPVLANPSAHEMGLLRPGIAGGADGRAHADPYARRPGPAHRHPPRGGTRHAPRARRRSRSGVHIRAVALDDGHVTIEALDVTESHRLNRVRRDFVANVSHELKTPVGALQLLAEALQRGDGRRRYGRRPGRRPPLRRADPARVQPARPAGHRVAGAVPAAGRRAAAGAGPGGGRPGGRRGDRPYPDRGARPRASRSSGPARAA